MVTVRCPVCLDEAEIPEKFLGKKVRCKSPECRQVFVAAEFDNSFTDFVDEVIAPPPPDDSADVTLDHWRSAFRDAESRQLETQQLQQERLHQQHQEEARRQSEQEHRYPALMKYLRWSSSMANIGLALWLLMALIAGVLTIIGEVRDAGSVTGLIGGILYGLMVCVLLGGIGYALYIATVAGIEFVKVIIDIEANTRHPRVATHGHRDDTVVN